jgi:hypothetical protein
MPQTLDPKRLAGNSVHAKASHVIGIKRARNRFGSQWKVTWLTGTVEGVIKERVKVREQVSVDVSWRLGETVLRKAVKVSLVRKGEASGSSDLHTNPQTGHEGVEDLGQGEEDGIDRQTLSNAYSHHRCDGR